MKKTFVVILCAIAVFAGGYQCRVSLSEKELNISEIAKVNIEALAAPGKEEDGLVCWETITNEEASEVLYCGTCTYIPGTHTFWASKGKCSPK